ncbi:heme-dependent oxidative N-demethylase family protein [Thiosulfatihalobacter marinus]|uniref:heme-dependent oxidative N-demethylase family protein n=1 Tax=Thiosulfatihalobacter marinus TaxID=2792481 RepID=UPI0018D87CF1|nr:DUF3445 domain-containing protein [Thiosulfatihalobacter marinus]
MIPVLQKTIPFDPFDRAALPGIAPLPPEEWLHVDDAYAGQMHLREAILRTRRKDVVAVDAGAMPAAQELLVRVLEQLTRREGFARRGNVMICPDGREVSVEADDPLGSVGRLVQEDMCLLQKHGDQHVLTGAVLCFPASWSLSEKFMKPLTDIHTPVSGYDENIASRVQRLFDGVRKERPLWRRNALWYNDPALHQPRHENAPRDHVNTQTAPYLRSELQSILRLPDSDAVVFSIHTFVLARENLPDPHDRDDQNAPIANPAPNA